MSCPGHRSASVLCRHHQHVSLKVFCHDDAYSVNTCLINQRALSARTRVLYARSPFIHSRCIRTSSLKCPSTQYLLFPQPPQPLARLLCMLNRANPLSVSSHSCCGLGCLSSKIHDCRITQIFEGWNYINPHLIRTLTTRGSLNQSQ